MNVEKKILFVGPVPPPFHGQSIAFLKAIEFSCFQKTIIDINLTGKSIFGKLFFSFLINIRMMMAFVVKSPDIIYFTCSRSLLGSLRDVLLLQLAGLFGKPVINHLHGADFRDFFYSVPYFYRLILINSYRNVNCSIVLIDAMIGQFDMFPDMQISVVPNFYAKGIGCNSPGNCRKRNSPISFIFLSNIMKTKGIFLLLDAFVILSKRYSDLELTIAGKCLADDELGVDDASSLLQSYLDGCSNIKYLGVVSGEQKAALLRDASVFVLPTYYKSEAVPLSIIEAMASGCGIVVTRHNYLPDFIGEDNGLLVGPNDLESLVNGLERYIVDPHLLARHQKNNILYASSNFAEDRYLSAISEILKRYCR